LVAPGIEPKTSGFVPRNSDHWTTEAVHYHTQQSSNMKLFGAKRRRENAKTLQFLKLTTTKFDRGGNSRQLSVSVRHHGRASLDPRKVTFLKLMMQSSCFLKGDARLQ
jgi:hypothetical protein